MAEDAQGGQDWLDRATAEWLLRGGTAGVPEGPVTPAAGRLNEALSGVRRARDALPGGGAGELPGEAAALAAFRAARERADGPVGAGALSLGVVRLARQPRPVPFGGRMSRSARSGVIALVAAFAFSGVAVATGTGLLPSPFAQSRPGVSGQGPVLPDPVGGGTPGGSVQGFAPPSPPADRDPSPGRSGKLQREGDPDGAGDDGDDDGDRDRDRRPGDHRGVEKDWRHGPDRHPWMGKACRKYRDDTIADRWRQRLERHAGSGGVEAFCDQILGRPDPETRGSGTDGAGGGRGYGGRTADGWPGPDGGPDRHPGADGPGGAARPQNGGAGAGSGAHHRPGGADRPTRPDRGDQPYRANEPSTGDGRYDRPAHRDTDDDRGTGAGRDPGRTARTEHPAPYPLFPAPQTDPTRAPVTGPHHPDSGPLVLGERL
ncbi:hypothetical protein ABT354_19275 [Streptomyces sp. NPDC000594]|uniref:hypothetical protein n=1 Tax=Streptomyces sp. NPDC000594 TaxID=3154261 RepID=UPI00332884B0